METLLGIVEIPGKRVDHAHVCGECGNQHVVLERDDDDLVGEQLAVVSWCAESVARCQQMKAVISMKAVMSKKAVMKS